MAKLPYPAISNLGADKHILEGEKGKEGGGMVSKHLLGPFCFKTIALRSWR